MPADYVIDSAHRLVISRGHGVFIAADYQEHMIRLLRDPAFDPDFDQLVDCRSIVKMDLSGQQIMALASRSVFSTKSRRAFVVVSDVQFGLSRMLAAHRETMEGQSVMVFRQMSEALAWLGRPADLIPDRATEPPPAA